MELLDPSPPSLHRAAEALKAGRVVAYPTETVYGLAVDPFSEEALEELFAAKGRERDQAILLIVGGQEQLKRVVTAISPRAQRYMDAFWPGPLSLLLPKHPDLPDAVAPGREKICVRCPGAEVARRLCEVFGGPITSTSANRSGTPPVQDLRDLDLERVSLGIDAGPLAPSEASTILDPETGAILRQGAIGEQELRPFSS